MTLIGEVWIDVYPASAISAMCSFIVLNDHIHACRIEP